MFHIENSQIGDAVPAIHTYVVKWSPNATRKKCSLFANNWRIAEHARTSTQSYFGILIILRWRYQKKKK